MFAYKKGCDILANGKTARQRTLNGPSPVDQRDNCHTKSDAQTNKRIRRPTVHTMSSLSLSIHLSLTLTHFMFSFVCSLARQQVIINGLLIKLIHKAIYFHFAVDRHLVRFVMQRKDCQKRKQTKRQIREHHEWKEKGKGEGRGRQLPEMATIEAD